MPRRAFFRGEKRRFAAALSASKRKTAVSSFCHSLLVLHKMMENGMAEEFL